MKIYIYDNAIIQTNPARIARVGDVGGERGNVQGLSYASRRRMLDFLIKNEPQDCEKIIALTLTTRPLEDGEFRRKFYLWRNELSRKKIPLFWRIELHRSGFPHIHALVGSDDASDMATALWRRFFHDDCGERGILTRDASNASAWVSYICLHHSKKSMEQDGWKGRQWGVTYRAGWVSREYAVVEVQNAYIDTYVRRMVNRLCKLRGQRIDVPQHQTYSRLGINPFEIRKIIKKAEKSYKLKVKKTVDLTQAEVEDLARAVGGTVDEIETARVEA